MNTNRAGYSFFILGLAALAAGIGCLGWANSLGGFSFIGATAAVFLAMLSFIRFAALRRPPTAARAIPMPDPMYESIRAPIMPSERAAEDAELAAKLAALRMSARHSSVPSIAAREPDPAVVVVEGPPLEAELAQLFATPSVEPAPAPEPATGLRQMDELRAEIARLREGARMRHAGGGARAGVSVAPPNFPAPASQPACTDAQFPRTEFSGLPGESAVAPSQDGEVFPRTEFSGLGGPSSEASPFTKTEYLGPADLPR